MRIEQCYSAFGKFGPDLRAKYDLKPYKDKHKPTLFYGLYGTQVEQVLNHKSTAVILWAGTDSLTFIQNKEYVEALRKRPDTYFVAKSKFIAEDMQKIGFDYKYIPITTQKNDDIIPCPLGDSIYLYKGDSVIYGREINDKVIQAFPNINIIISKHNDYDREGILDVYKKCFIALRCINHDGFSHTVVEMGLMGRPSVWNGGTPYSFGYNNADDVIKIVGDTYENRKSYDYMKVHEAVKDYIHESDDFLYTEYYN